MDALNTFAFEDAAGVMGGLTLELGRVGERLDRRLGHRTYNASPFGRALLLSLDEIRQVHGAQGGARAAAEKARRAIGTLAERLAGARMQVDDAGLIAREVAVAARLARHGCGRMGLALEGDCGRVAGLRAELGAEPSAILRDHEPLWHARNRPGGYGDSVAGLQRLLTDY